MTYPHDIPWPLMIFFTTPHHQVGQSHPYHIANHPISCPLMLFVQAPALSSQQSTITSYQPHNSSQAALSSLHHTKECSNAGGSSAIPPRMKRWCSNAFNVDKRSSKGNVTKQPVNCSLPGYRNTYHKSWQKERGFVSHSIISNSKMTSLHL